MATQQTRIAHIELIDDVFFYIRYRENIVVTKDVYLNLKKEGWKETSFTTGSTNLAKKPYEITFNLNYGKYYAFARHLIKSANMIKGVPFINLKELMKFKKEMNRDKDKKDIELIENYLRSKK